MMNRELIDSHDSPVGINAEKDETWSPYLEREPVWAQFAHEEFEAGFIPVATSRSIGMFLDARVHQQPDKARQRANELYRRCMARSLLALVA